jgi:glycerate kinase
MTAARPWTILIAPDSFKGSLSSVQIATALADGWGRARPNDRIVMSPLADGGEGTLEAVAAAGGWTWQTTAARDPMGRVITARWLRSEDGTHAVIEMAEASGLSRLAPDERDPIGASTIGTGDLLRAALDVGVGSIVMGIGGSATTDGGRGMLEALDGMDDVLADVTLQVACDVTNRLLGPAGAAATYGPQKGATPEDVAMLDERLARWADELDARTGRYERDTSGAGAAGGLGYAFLSIQGRFRSFALRPGVELVMEATGFDDKLAQADLVITGEGRIDAQTAFGKTALGVARQAHVAGVGCIAVGGGVEPEGIDALASVGAVAVPVTERPQSIEAAMAAGTTPVERCGQRLAALLSLGARTAER